MTLLKRQHFRVKLLPWVKGEERIVARKHEITFWDVGNILYLDYGYTNINIKLCIYKSDEFCKYLFFKNAYIIQDYCQKYVLYYTHLYYTNIYYL